MRCAAPQRCGAPVKAGPLLLHRVRYTASAGPGTLQSRSTAPQGTLNPANLRAGPSARETLQLERPADGSVAASSLARASPQVSTIPDLQRSAISFQPNSNPSPTQAVGCGSCLCGMLCRARCMSGLGGARCWGNRGNEGRRWWRMGSFGIGWSPCRPHAGFPAAGLGPSPGDGPGLASTRQQPFRSGYDDQLGEVMRRE